MCSIVRSSDRIRLRSLKTRRWWKDGYTLFVRCVGYVPDVLFYKMDFWQVSLCHIPFRVILHWLPPLRKCRIGHKGRTTDCRPDSDRYARHWCSTVSFVRCLAACAHVKQHIRRPDLFHDGRRLWKAPADRLPGFVRLSVLFCGNLFWPGSLPRWYCYHFSMLQSMCINWVFLRSILRDCLRSCQQTFYRFRWLGLWLRFSLSDLPDSVLPFRFRSGWVLYPVYRLYNWRPNQALHGCPEYISYCGCIGSSHVLLRSSGKSPDPPDMFHHTSGILGKRSGFYRVSGNWSG